MHILLTGGTGLLGSFLLPRLVLTYPATTVTLLIRAEHDEDAARRYNEILARLSLFTPLSLPMAVRERIQWVRGDVGQEHLGMGRDRFTELAGTLTHIVHGAASIRFDLPLNEARAVNCGGTRRLLDLARQCAKRGTFERFMYIGTSSVSGTREGIIYEHELERGQSFFNTYEQTKAESERLVRDSFEEIPATIVRPSIVIGDSRTGRTTTFNVIYIPLRLVEQGTLRFLPGRSPDPVMDLVPVDWVCDVSAYIMNQPASVGGVYHLTAGPSRAVPLQVLAASALQFFDRESPRRGPRTLEFIPEREYRFRRSAMTHAEDALFTQLDILLPYITVNRLFDTSNTDTILINSGIHLPDFGEYAERIFGYCLASRWGKRPVVG